MSNSTPRSSCNYTTFKSAAFDKLFEEAAAERDAGKKVELMKKANALLQEEAPVWFFNYNKAVLAYQPWLHGLQPNATEVSRLVSCTARSCSRVSNNFSVPCSSGLFRS